jgi:hypothetical protein
MALFILAACSREEAAGPAEDLSQQAADLVMRGGTVATVDPALGTQQAIAVTEHEITAVGSDDEIAAWIGPETRVVELNGRFVMQCCQKPRQAKGVLPASR